MTHAAANHEVETFTGRYVDLADPKPETFDLRDIAHALANTCRFGGHSRVFYSVAEHAVRVADKLIDEHYSDFALAGLHHDDAEAYLGDIPRPLKPLLGEPYRAMTRAVDDAITEALGNLWGESYYLRCNQVRSADEWMLHVEARSMMASAGQGWSLGPPRWPVYGMQLGMEPYEAEALFLRRHEQLVVLEAQRAA
jgi:hypothetical protein